MYLNTVQVWQEEVYATQDTIKTGVVVAVITVKLKSEMFGRDEIEGWQVEDEVRLATDHQLRTRSRRFHRSERATLP